MFIDKDELSMLYGSKIEQIDLHTLDFKTLDYSSLFEIEEEKVKADILEALNLILYLKVDSKECTNCRLDHTDKDDYNRKTEYKENFEFLFEHFVRIICLIISINKPVRVKRLESVEEFYNIRDKFKLNLFLFISMNMEWIYKDYVGNYKIENKHGLFKNYYSEIKEYLETKNNISKKGLKLLELCYHREQIEIMLFKLKDLKDKSCSFYLKFQTLEELEEANDTCIEEINIFTNTYNKIIKPTLELKVKELPLTYMLLLEETDLNTDIKESWENIREKFNFTKEYTKDEVEYKMLYGIYYLNTVITTIENSVKVLVQQQEKILKELSTFVKDYYNEKMKLIG